jgi:hypothetical protein
MANPQLQTYARRLTFEFDGSTIRQISEQRVEMTVPSSHPTSEYSGHTGFWFELRDANENTIYRRVMADPLLGYHEVPSSQGTFTHSPITVSPQVFELVVPELPTAESLVIFGTLPERLAPIGTPAQEAARPARPRVGTQPAREIARINLREGRP